MWSTSRANCSNVWLKQNHVNHFLSFKFVCVATIQLTWPGWNRDHSIGWLDNIQLNHILFVHSSSQLHKQPVPHSVIEEVTFDATHQSQQSLFYYITGSLPVFLYNRIWLVTECVSHDQQGSVALQEDEIILYSPRPWLQASSNKKTQVSRRIFDSDRRLRVLHDVPVHLSTVALQPSFTHIYALPPLMTPGFKAG